MAILFSFLLIAHGAVYGLYVGHAVRAFSKSNPG